MKKILILLFTLLIFSFSFSFETDVLDEDVIPGIKFSQTLRIYLDDGKFPDKKSMQEIAYDIKKDNPGYENYFINFLLPNMPLNEGAFATANNRNGDNPDMKATILYFMLENNSHYSKYLKFDKNGNYYLKNMK